ncbi:unnamed protein product [Calypogeia fissa]
MACDLVVDSFREHMSKTSLEFLWVEGRGLEHLRTKSGLECKSPEAILRSIISLPKPRAYQCKCFPSKSLSDILEAYSWC